MHRNFPSFIELWHHIGKNSLHKRYQLLGNGYNFPHLAKWIKNEYLKRQLMLQSLACLDL